MHAEDGGFMRPCMQFIRVAILLVLSSAAARAQGPPAAMSSSDSVTVVAGAEYQAGALRRYLFGGAYRDIWLTRIRVPVLDLRTVDGGLKPTKMGGGVDTKSLHLVTPAGEEYVFRLVNKDSVSLPSGLDDVPLVRSIAHDQVTTTHPASNVVIPTLLEAAGILHETPVFYEMPDDSLLGKYRKVFANRLGMLQRFPSLSTGDAPAFAGAIEIIDSDSLRTLMDRSPLEQVDARAFLAARLIDMLDNNWDRHQKQWKWARLEAGGHAPWEPISRDQDKALIAATGAFFHVLGGGVPRMVPFRATYPPMRSLTIESVELDRRLLSGMSKATWDSVARAVQQVR